MLAIRNVGVVIYWGNGMFGMWDVWDVQCGMWNVCLDVGC